LALGSFTAEFGMGSGACLPAIATRPAKISGSLDGTAGWGLSRDGRMDVDNESDEADRAISTGKLHALLRVHTRPIDVVVYHGSDGEYWF
jgi:hypothetical protein